MLKDSKTGPPVETSFVIPEGHRILACFDKKKALGIEKLMAERQPFPAILHTFGLEETKQLPIMITGYSLIGRTPDTWLLYFRKVDGGDYALYTVHPYEEEADNVEDEGDNTDDDKVEDNDDEKSGKADKVVQYRREFLIDNYYSDIIQLYFDPSNPGYYAGSYAYVTIPIVAEIEDSQT